MLVNVRTGTNAIRIRGETVIAASQCDRKVRGRSLVAAAFYSKGRLEAMPGSRDIVRKKRTEITIEIDELMVVKSRRQGTVRMWCPACSTEVTMVTPGQAAAITAASVRTINRWVESGMVHFTETHDGLLLLCADSLQANERRGTH